MAGQDQEPRPSLPRLDPFLARGTFEHSNGSGSDRDHSLAMPLRLDDGARGGLVDPVPLTMDRVLARIVDPDGPKRVYADVQGDEGHAHAALGHGGYQLGGEVQTRGRRGRRSFLARIDGLISFPIAEPLLD